MQPATIHAPTTATTLPLSASLRLWGLAWDRVLPWTLAGVTVAPVRFADALPFIRESYPVIFGGLPGVRDDRFLATPMTDAKKRFCEESDTFLFRDGERTVGLLMASPSDWSTYYMRSVAILPEYRARRLLTGFMERCYAPLEAAGVERIEGECSPANVPMTRMLASQGFLVTSTGCSERWGMTVRYTRFLSNPAAAIFRRQFSSLPLDTEPTRGAATSPERSLS
jgi:hypothetical protein